MDEREKLRVLVEALRKGAQSMPYYSTSIVKETAPVIEEISIEDRELLPPKVFLAGVHKEDGWLYYVDKDGDIARSPMNRPKKARKVKVSNEVKKRVKKTVKVNADDLASNVLKLEMRLKQIKREENVELYDALKTKIEEIKKKISRP